MLGKIREGSFCKSGIERIVIPKGVEEIEESVFCQCKGLTEVVFEDGSQLKKIGAWAFRGTRVESVAIPNSVVEIQDSALRDCKNLKEVVFEAGSVLKKIGNRAFYDCTSLRNILFPDGLETIGTICF